MPCTETKVKFSIEETVDYAWSQIARMEVIMNRGSRHISRTKPLLASGLLMILMSGWWLWVSAQSASFSAPHDLARWAGAAEMSSIFSEPWRLVSSTVLHLHLEHLVFNALFVTILAAGHAIQTTNRETLCIYFLSGAGGTLAGCAMQHGLFLGASGAMFGLLGANIVAMRNRVNKVELTLTACVALALTWLNPGDLNAHIAGLFLGCVLEFLGLARSRRFAWLFIVVCMLALSLAVTHMVSES